jgi:hypothetical protein
MLHSSLARLASVGVTKWQFGTLAFRLFGQRIVSFKVPQNVDTLPSKYLDDHGEKQLYQVLTTKLHQQSRSTHLDWKALLWFGRAYKDAIDIGKHGVLVKLAAHLWGRLLEHFHSYLTK